jgi:AcrR family transcriptional regulator
MTDHSRLSTDRLTDSLSSSLRRQPTQQRSKARVEKILEAAAIVFDEVGYEAATTHLIAAKAGTAIGSLYQFFPDKAALFNALELRHVERVHGMWAKTDMTAIAQVPLRLMIRGLVAGVGELFENPVSRVVFISFFTSRQIFQSIDDRMTQDAIAFMAQILARRNPSLSGPQGSLLAEVCVHSSNALILATLRTTDLHRRHQLTQQIEDLLVAYLEPYMGDSMEERQNVMKVMICPHCRSPKISKNGNRRGKQCYLCKDCGKQFVNSQIAIA